MFGLRAHIDVTTCDIYGIRIFFSLPMLWESALLSLLVRFTNSDIRITFSLFHPVISDAYPSSRVAGVRTPDPGPWIPFLIQGRPRVLWYKLRGQQFSCGVIDIVESMLRRAILTAVYAPPTESFFLNFYDVTLSDYDRLCAKDMYV